MKTMTRAVLALITTLTAACASQEPATRFDRFERCMTVMNTTYMSTAERFRAADLCMGISRDMPLKAANEEPARG